MRRAIEQGRFQSMEDAVTEALLLWEAREARRIEFLADLDAAEAALDHGASNALTDVNVQALAEDIKRMGGHHRAADGRIPT